MIKRMLLSALIFGGAFLLPTTGCSDKKDSYRDRSDFVSDEEYDEYRREERHRLRKKARNKRTGASILGRIPYLSIGSGAVRQSARENDREADQSWREEQYDQAQRLRDSMNAAHIEASQREQDRRDQIARQKKAERDEANRDRSFPANQMDSTAERIANTIERELLVSNYVNDFTEKYNAKLALYSDRGVSKARNTPSETAEQLLRKVMVRLGRSAAIKETFEITMSKSEAKALIERSEGKSNEIRRIDRKSKEAPRGISSSAILGVSLRVFENDQPGRTTWEVQFEVPNPKSRSKIVQEEIHVP